MSAFSLNEFYQRNRRVVIWVILFLLLWLLRDFFAVVFLSFVLAIVAAPLAEIGMRRLRLPHWAAVTVVYVSFLVVLGSFVAFVVPSVVSQLNRMIQNLPSTEATLIETKNRLVRSYPALREPINGYLRSALADDRLELVELELISTRQRLGLTEEDLAAAAESAAVPTGVLAEYFNRQDQLLLDALMAVQFQRVRQYAPTVTVMLYRATATTLLALLFSFLILIDLNRIKAGISRLRNVARRRFLRGGRPAHRAFRHSARSRDRGAGRDRRHQHRADADRYAVARHSARRDVVGHCLRLQLRAGARRLDLDDADRLGRAQYGRPAACRSPRSVSSSSFTRSKRIS